MSNPLFAAMDARIMSTFFATGLADAAVYRTGGVDTPCTVVLDRTVQVLGEYGEVIGTVTSATFMRSEVTPRERATLTVGSEAWTLEKKTNEDESFSEWILNNG